MSSIEASSRRTAGIIDWHEARVRPIALELAEETFELCHDDEHRLRLDRAGEFVAVYCASGVPVLETRLPRTPCKKEARKRTPELKNPNVRGSSLLLD